MGIIFYMHSAKKKNTPYTYFFLIKHLLLLITIYAIFIIFNFFSTDLHLKTINLKNTYFGSKVNPNNNSRISNSPGGLF